MKINGLNVTLTSVQENKALSEETPCFTAVVCIDGKPVAFVGNNGHGGCCNIQQIDPAAYLHLYAAAEKVTKSKIEPVDTLVYALLDQRENRQRMVRALKTHVLYTTPADRQTGDYYKTPLKQGSRRYTAEAVKLSIGTPDKQWLDTPAAIDQFLEENFLRNVPLT